MCNLLATDKDDTRDGTISDGDRSLRTSHVYGLMEQALLFYSEVGAIVIVICVGMFSAFHLKGLLNKFRFILTSKTIRVEQVRGLPPEAEQTTPG